MEEKPDVIVNEAQSTFPIDVHALLKYNYEEFEAAIQVALSGYFEDYGDPLDYVSFLVIATDLEKNGVGHISVHLKHYPAAPC